MKRFKRPPPPVTPAVYPEPSPWVGSQGGTWTPKVSYSYDLYSDEVTAVSTAIAGTWSTGGERVEISLPMATFISHEVIQAIAKFRDPRGRRIPQGREEPEPCT